MPIFNDDNKFIVTKKLIDGNKEIIIIDNFLYDIDDIKKKGKSLEAEYTQDSYPGEKKLLLINDTLKTKYDNIELSSEQYNICQDIVNKSIKEIYKLEKYINGKKLEVRDIHYANVSVNPKLLTKFQSQPHIDNSNSPESKIYAIVVYLNEDENSHGGTGFYNHIKSGCSVLTTEEKVQILREESENIKKPKYMCDTNDVWELDELVAMKKNRAVIYPSHVFHTPYIKELYKFNDEGRHTFNLFLEEEYCKGGVYLGRAESE